MKSLASSLLLSLSEILLGTKASEAAVHAASDGKIAIRKRLCQATEAPTPQTVYLLEFSVSDCDLFIERKHALL